MIGDGNINAAGVSGTKASANPLSIVQSLVWSSADLQDIVWASAFEFIENVFTELWVFDTGKIIFSANFPFLLERLAKVGLVRNSRLANPII